MKMHARLLVLLIIAGFLSFQCASVDGDSSPSVQPVQSSGNDEVLGYGILARLPGLWNGPVSTTTPAGSFPIWYVDFRPVSAAQVSQYSTLDAQTLNYLSFFIVKHDGQLKVAMRTEGVFQNQGCVTYEVMDTAREEEGFYRFSDFRAGEGRAYTEFTFGKNEFVMETFTNKFNKVSPLEQHSIWKAKLGDRSAAEITVEDLSFPQPVMVKDFSDVFKNMSESIYYTFENDPYSSSSQPYVGTVTVNLSVEGELPVKNDHELFLLLTTDSLFDGYTYREGNLKYISRHVYLPPDTKSYTFQNVHPGTYYVYSYNDVNGDKRHLSGDYMSSNLENIFTLSAEGHAQVDTVIDYIIP